jgi:hypothetical protein
MFIIRSWYLFYSYPHSDQECGEECNKIKHGDLLPNYTVSILLITTPALKLYDNNLTSILHLLTIMI